MVINTWIGEAPHISDTNAKPVSFWNKNKSAIVAAIAANALYRVEISYDAGQSNKLDFNSIKNTIASGLYAELPQFPDPTPDDPNDESPFYGVNMWHDLKARTATFIIFRLPNHPSNLP